MWVIKGGCVGVDLGSGSTSAKKGDTNVLPEMRGVENVSPARVTPLPSPTSASWSFSVFGR